MSDSRNHLKRKVAVATVCLLVLVSGAQTTPARGAHTPTVTVTAAS